jgi:S1-C subfamily serine protease
MRNLLWVRLCCAIAAVTGAVGLIEGPAPAQQDSGTAVYKQTLKSVVWLVTAKTRGKTIVTASGTGSVVDVARKLVLTNYHVIGDDDKVIALFPVYQKGQLVAERKFYSDLIGAKKVHVGKVIAKDMQHDLALVQLETMPSDVVPIRLARESVGPGQRVHSVGNPGGSGALWVYTSGTVRQVYRKQWRAKSGDEILEFDSKVVETQSPTNPGDSGGPLVNDRGELVAVTQGGAVDGQLLSLFIEVSEVKALLASKGLAKLVPPPPPVTAEKPPDPPKTENPPDDLAKQEQLAASKLKLAKLLHENGKLDKARERYEEIVATYPKTKAAEEAKRLLGRK